jgi:ArsR family transcriptional regulator, arsenate/arsenite/antimonite-responsive transcriptional repressor / arsenate reductase (thioredoxin)
MPPPSIRCASDWKVLAGHAIRFGVRERCPTWLDSSPIHWSLPDPTTAEGSEAERQQVFDQLASQLDVRIRLLLTLLE